MGIPEDVAAEKYFTVPDALNLLVTLEDKAYGGRKLVVVTDKDWNRLVQAYGSELIRRVGKNAIVFHPVKKYETKETLWLFDDIDDI